MFTYIPGVGVVDVVCAVGVSVVPDIVGGVVVVIAVFEIGD